MTEQYLTVAEVAALLRVHRNTVLRMIERHELAASKIGRQWRIPAAEVRRKLGQ